MTDRLLVGLQTCLTLVWGKILDKNQVRVDMQLDMIRRDLDIDNLRLLSGQLQRPYKALRQGLHHGNQLGRVDKLILLNMS